MHQLTTFDPERIRALHESQRAASALGLHWSAAERKERLRGLETALLRHAPALRAALADDLGKHRDESDLTEINPSLAEVRHARRNVERWMRPQRVPTPNALFAARSEVRHEPKGHVLIIAPWNYPVFLSVPPLAAALAAGNRVLLRPSEKAPHTAAALAELVTSAFSTDDVAVVGGGVDAAEFLLTLPFDHIFYTGGERVGRRVLHAAAEHLSPVTLELGGKSPAIVAADAELASAARRIVWGKFINAGQTCVAPDYVLVDARVEQALIVHLKRALARAYGRTERERAQNSSACKLVDDAAYARLRDLIEASVTEGARLDAGGCGNAASRTLAPTILSHVAPDSPAMAGEIFGPILPVLRVENVDAAIATVNARPKPLALYVFTRSRGIAEEVIARTSSGGSAINDTVLQLANPYLPFGGAGASGFGSYHGKFGFRTFSHERALLVGRPFGLGFLMRPPYGPRTRAVAALIRRFFT